MIYLENFRFPSLMKEQDILWAYDTRNPTSKYIDNVTYPFGILSSRGLHSLDFSEITILYGGNGSGKSTALNIIGEKLGLHRQSPYNKGHLQSLYLEHCTCKESNWHGSPCDLKEISSFMTSDDIFKQMLDVRTRNNHFEIRRDKTIDEILRIKSGRLTADERHAKRHLDFETGENVDTFIRTTDMQLKTLPRFLRDEMGRKEEAYSNGETGFLSFVESIIPNHLYILDEPENSLSCELQMKLAEYIELSAKHSGCQFIIATHSPFILAIATAKIYNLDAEPAAIAKWWELPNMQLYYRLFKQYDGQFSDVVK